VPLQLIQLERSTEKRTTEKNDSVHRDFPYWHVLNIGGKASVLWTGEQKKFSLHLGDFGPPFPTQSQATPYSPAALPVGPPCPAAVPQRRLTGRGAAVKKQLQNLQAHQPAATEGGSTAVIVALCKSKLERWKVPIPNVGQSEMPPGSFYGQPH
jgi:hypothetical protein